MHELSLKQKQRNWVFATNSKLLTLINIYQSNGANLWDFKLRLFEIIAYDIGLQRYRDKKIRVCDKKLIPFRY